MPFQRRTEVRPHMRWTNLQGRDYGIAGAKGAIINTPFTQG